MCNTFRPLKSSEVVVRPVEVGSKTVSLLLYQDARCAQNILDDTVGPFNWQKVYYDSNGMLFCKIGIRDKDSGEWIWKSDTGSESNIEAEKGLASDAFKRAAVSWGIGRELYTAPRIQVQVTEKDFYNGKLAQQFKVSDMLVENGAIVSLVLCDKWGTERFRFPSKGIPQTTKMEPKKKLSKTDLLIDFCSAKKEEEGTNLSELKRFFEYYTKPSKNNPNISIIESWTNPKPDLMWENWLGKSRAA